MLSVSKRCCLAAIEKHHNHSSLHLGGCLFKRHTYQTLYDFLTFLLHDSSPMFPWVQGFGSLNTPILLSRRKPENLGKTCESEHWSSNNLHIKAPLGIELGLHRCKARRLTAAPHAPENVQDAKRKKKEKKLSVSTPPILNMFRKHFREWSLGQ